MNLFRTLFLLLLIQCATVHVFAQKGTIDSNMVLHTTKGDIYGTLQVAGVKKKMPVVLIIAGSGPVDRNGNHDKMINNSLMMLADSLQLHGIASLRYDKRGIGASKAAAPSENELRFDDYISDAEGWIKMLKQDKRFSKVIVLGHSEGSLIGMVAAKEENAKAFISVDGAGKPADQMLREQLKLKVSPTMMDTCNQIFDALLNGNEVKNVDKRLGMIFRPSVQPYLISWFKYNPQTEIAKLKIPILLIQGTTDMQVKEEEVKLLANANTAAKLKIIEGMNHIMKAVPASFADNLSADMNPKLPLMTECVKAIVSFVK